MKQQNRNARYVRLFQSIIENGNTTYQELADTLHVSKKTVGKYLTQLQDQLATQKNVQLHIKPGKGVSVVGSKASQRKCLAYLQHTLLLQNDTPPDSYRLGKALC